jgi:hypothetical protein
MLAVPESMPWTPMMASDMNTTSQPTSGRRRMTMSTSPRRQHARVQDGRDRAAARLEHAVAEIAPGEHAAEDARAAQQHAPVLGTKTTP